MNEFNDKCFPNFLMGELTHQNWKDSINGRYCLSLLRNKDKNNIDYNKEKEQFFYFLKTLHNI
jgi:hypothetical protein